jgi:hypothetical protein
MKMHQMSSKIGGVVRSIFTDTIIFEVDIIKPECNKDIISGIKETSIKEFTKCMNTKPRENNLDEC